MSGLLGALFDLLYAGVGTLAGRVMTAVGVGWLTYSGLDLFVSQVVAMVKSHYGAMPGDVLSFLGLTGASEGVGIILGALVARVSLISLSRLAHLLK